MKMASLQTSVFPLKIMEILNLFMQIMDIECSVLLSMHKKQGFFSCLLQSSFQFSAFTKCAQKRWSIEGETIWSLFSQVLESKRDRMHISKIKADYGVCPGGDKDLCIQRQREHFCVEEIRKKDFQSMVLADTRSNM